MLQTVSWMVTREEPASQAKMSGVILRWFLAGGFAGGVVAGLLVAGPARVIYLTLGNRPRLFATAAVVFAIGYLGNVLKLWRLPKPQIAQQVPPSWRDVWPPRLASFLYAGTLGLTFFTRVSSLALFPLVVLALGFGSSPLAIVALFATTGLLRAGTALIVPMLGWADLWSGRRIVAAMEAAWRTVERFEAAVLTAAASLLLVAAIAWT
jgi:hypothetical protein